MLIGRFRERKEFEAAIHGMELKDQAYATDEEFADFFGRLGKPS